MWPASGLVEIFHYPDEVRAVERPALPETLVNKREIEMANQLIDFLVEPFEPEKYQDEYREALLELIATKRERKRVRPERVEPERKPPDLMSALRASLEEARKKKGASAASSKPAASRRRTRKTA